MSQNVIYQKLETLYRTPIFLRGSSVRCLFCFRSHSFTVNPTDKEIGLCVKLWGKMFSFFIKRPISLMF